MMELQGHLPSRAFGKAVKYTLRENMQMMEDDGFASRLCTKHDGAPLLFILLGGSTLHAETP